MRLATEKILPLLAALLMAAGTPAMADGHSDQLTAALRAQPDDARARYEHRHPAQTLEFFGVKPGMTIVEVLPGFGWYTKILLPYLGPEGHVVGADYPIDIFVNLGFFTEQWLEERKNWPETWPKDAQGWSENGASVSAFRLGAMPDSAKESVDMVLLIRALHNLARFENQGGYLTTALKDVYDILKPGGVVGVVQHHARDDRPDEWANGSRGYLKKSLVIGRMEAAGFQFVDESDINANPKDQPGDNDIVWRLSPTLVTSRGKPTLRKELMKIGESNRMTLKFVKPK